MSTGADRNLLFGILAHQTDFIDRDQLIAAMNAWVLEKQTPLGEILVRQKALDPANRDLLESLVDRHVLRHAGEPRRSLMQSGSVATSLRVSLRALGDVDLDASLAALSMSDDVIPPLPSAEQPGEPPRDEGGSVRFRVLRPHARGGLGEVHVAEDVELHREVALKRIQDQYLADRGARERFVVEAEITGRLEHPGIVPVYGLGTDACGRPFYAMRFIRGDSLKEAIAEFHAARKAGGHDPVIPLRKLLSRLIDVCEAIDYAHSRGVLHRDLKPGNIMLGKYGETLVVDWGLAKPVGREEPRSHDPAEATIRPSSGSQIEQTKAGGLVGTPSYMSPEQAAGRLDKIGVATDVYGLGATLYAILTGHSPAEQSATESLEEMLERVQQGSIPPPRQIAPWVPRALQAICQKAMANNPADRYPTARAMADDLEAWLADEPVSAWKEPLAVRARRWMSRRPGLMSGAATLVVAAMAFGLIGMAVLDRKNDQLSRALDRAEKNFRLALDSNVALNEMAVELRKMHGVRLGVVQELLSATESNYGLLAEAGSTPELLFRKGRMLTAYALLTLDLGRTDLARKQSDASLELLRALSADKTAEEAFPEGREIRRELAAALDASGVVAALQGRLDEAEAKQREALELRQQERRRQPDSGRAWADLSSGHARLAQLLSNYGDYLGAVAERQTAAQAAAEAHRLDPEDKELQWLAARARWRLASELYNANRLEESAQEYAVAEGLWTALAPQVPGRADWSRELHEFHDGRALLHLAQGDPQAARRHWETARELANLGLRADPNNATWLMLDLRSQFTIGQALLSRDFAARARELEAALRKLIPASDARAASDPLNVQWAADRASARMMLANLLPAMAETTDQADAFEREAMEWLDQAERIAMPLVDAAPLSLRHTQSLAGPLTIRASHHRRAGRLEAAQRDARRARDLLTAYYMRHGQRDPQRLWWRAGLAEARLTASATLSLTGLAQEALEESRHAVRVAEEAAATEGLSADEVTAAIVLRARCREALRTRLTHHFDAPSDDAPEYKEFASASAGWIADLADLAERKPSAAAWRQLYEGYLGLLSDLRLEEAAQAGGLRVTFVSAEEVFQRALAAREKFFAIDPTAAARNPFVSENNASVALEASARGFRQENLEVGRSHLESCVLLWQMTPSPSRTEELLNSCAAVVALLDRNSPTEWIEGFHLLSETALWLEISRRRNALLPAQERWSTFVSAALESWDDAMAELSEALPALTESERVSWLSGDYAALWSAAAADPQRLPVVLMLLDREARAAAGAAPWLRKKIRERWKAGWNKPPNREERRKAVEAWCSAQNEFPQPEAADKDTVMTQIGKALLDELVRDEEPGTPR